MAVIIIREITGLFKGIAGNVGLNRGAVKKLLLFGALFIALILFGFTMIKPLSAEADFDSRTVKLVESVQIEKGDSLWSIAKEYYSDECGGMKQYINEIKKTNHLYSDTIHEGNYLLVPYYVR